MYPSKNLPFKEKSTKKTTNRTCLENRILNRKKNSR